MAVDEVGEVVLDQVLAGHAHVHGVPVLELGSQTIQRCLGDVTPAGVAVRLQEDVVPHLQAQLLWPAPPPHSHNDRVKREAATTNVFDVSRSTPPTQQKREAAQRLAGQHS